jgi:hypothetical protein
LNAWPDRGTGALVARSVCAMLAACLSQPAYASDASLNATAGIGGIAKAERWMPVHVDVRSGGPLPDGRLVVSWGDARLTQRIAFTTAGSRTFELYLRTAEPATTVSVALRSESGDVATIDVPVRIVPPADPVTLCLSSGTAAFDNPSCSSVVPVKALPLSPRGYEVVDRIIWMDADTPVLASKAQRVALEEWQMLRQLDKRGDLALAPRATLPSIRRGLPTPTRNVIIAGGVVYLLLVVVAGVLLGVRGASVSRAYATALILVVAGTAAAWALGRSGPASAIRVHQASVLQQLPDTPGALVEMTGLAEFPARDQFDLGVEAGDVSLDAASATRQTAYMVDEGGLAIIHGSFGLGGRQLFRAEGVVDVQPLALLLTERDVRVTNRSSWPLHDCRFGEGLTAVEPQRLAPGEEMKTTFIGGVSGPIVSCVADESPVSFHADGHVVRVAGTTRIVAYRTDQNRARNAVD